MSLEHKTFRLDAKDGEDGDGPQFAGDASVMGNKDLDDEVIDEGAFKRTLDHRNGKVMLLSGHNPADRLGIAELEERGKKLKLKGFMNMAKQISIDTLSDIRFNIKHTVALGLSVGFRTIKDMVQDGVRHIKEVDLWEVSVVTFPANPRAKITSAKFVSLMENIAELKSRFLELPEGTRPQVVAAIKSLTALLAGPPPNIDPATQRVTAAAPSIYGNEADEGLSQQDYDREAINKYALYLKGLTQELTHG